MWVKLDDQFFRNRKARSVGKDGRELFLASCCFSAAALTDGFIAKGDLPVLCAEAEVKASVAARLVDAGLWHEVEGGWEIHHFTEMNPTAEQVKERRRQTKERQDRFREARNAARNGVTNATPSRPDPTRPEGAGVGSSSPVLKLIVDESSCELCEGMGVIEREDGIAEDCECKAKRSA